MRNTPALALVLLGSLSLAACGRGSDTMPTPTVSVPTNGAITLPVRHPAMDAALPESERAIMSKVLRDLGPMVHGDIIYVDNSGGVHSNNSSLLKLVSIHRLVNGSYRDESGHLVAVPGNEQKPSEGNVAPLSVSPPATTTSGYYRRIFTSYPNSTFADLDFIVPCDAVPYSLPGPVGDTGYVYTGGWDETGNEYLDAAMQFSATYRHFNPFFHLDKQTIVTTTDTYQCGQEHGIELSVGYGYLAADFYDIVQNFNGSGKPGPTNEREIVGTPTFFDNWSNGATLKAMISLAQDPGLVATYGYNGVIEDGYYFGAPGGLPSINLRASFGTCYMTTTTNNILERICQTNLETFAPSQLQQVPDSSQVEVWSPYQDSVNEIELDGIAPYNDPYPYGAFPNSTPTPAPDPTPVPTPHCAKCPPQD